MRRRVSVTVAAGVHQSVIVVLVFCMTIAPATHLVASRGTTPADASSGTLTVASDPTGAAVYVDGQFVGETPLSVQRLQAGDHRVRIVKDGYLENGRVVNVSAGKSGTVQVRLTRRPAGAAAPVGQTGPSGVSSGGGNGFDKKWLYIGLAGGGAAAAAVLLAGRNHAPTIGGVTPRPSTGLQGTSIAFTTSGASDEDGDTLSYSWDFGDGGTATGASSSHVYNATGTFSITVTVSDGKKSATATTTVTVRSLTGNWSGQLALSTETFTLTQTGSTFSGTYRNNILGAGTVSGSVRTTSPSVTFTVTVPTFDPYVFTGDPSGDANTLTGVANQSGFINDRWVLTRQ